MLKEAVCKVTKTYILNIKVNKIRIQTLYILFPGHFNYAYISFALTRKWQEAYLVYIVITQGKICKSYYIISVP